MVVISMDIYLRADGEYLWNQGNLGHPLTPSEGRARRGIAMWQE